MTSKEPSEPIKAILLTLSPELRECGTVKSFAVTKSKTNTNIVVELNGKYDNKIVVCDFKVNSWTNTQKILRETLEYKKIDGEDVKSLRDTLDNNSLKILRGLDGFNDKEESDDVRKRESTKVLQLIDEIGAIKELFHDNLSNAYATVYVDSEHVNSEGHLETLPIYHSKFGKWLSRVYYKQRRTNPKWRNPKGSLLESRFSRRV